MWLRGYADSFPMATDVPSDPTEGSANIFPITPSRLPACTPECRSAERRRTLGAGRAALVLVAVGLRHGEALTPETELAGTKRLSPLRVP